MLVNVAAFNLQVENLNYDHLAELTEGFSGSDLHEVCRAAAVRTVHDFFSQASESL